MNEKIYLLFMDDHREHVVLCPDCQKTWRAPLSVIMSVSRGCTEELCDVCHPEKHVEIGWNYDAI